METFAHAAKFVGHYYDTSDVTMANYHLDHFRF